MVGFKLVCEKGSVNRAMYRNLFDGHILYDVANIIT
jgi:hypothetical protein